MRFNSGHSLDSMLQQLRLDVWPKPLTLSYNTIDRIKKNISSGLLSSGLSRRQSGQSRRVTPRAKTAYVLDFLGQSMAYSFRFSTHPSPLFAH